MSAAIDHLPKRLSILDDEEDLVSGLRRRLETRGFEVEVVTPPSSKIEDAINRIMEVSEVALCDHYLRGGLQVEYSGAELVATLTELKFPSVLFTGVLPDQRYEIRRNMARIPAFLTREEGMSPDQVERAMVESVSEVLKGQRAARRRGRRTPIAIVASRKAGNEVLFEASVSGWPSSDSIDIPADLLPEPWSAAPSDAVGKTFFALVNISEPDPDHLFFEEFEPDPVETERFLTETQG